MRGLAEEHQQPSGSQSVLAFDARLNTVDVVENGAVHSVSTPRAEHDDGLFGHFVQLNRIVIA